MVISKHRETFLILGQLFLFAAIFTFDLFLPLGVAAGVPYVAPILLSYYSRTSVSALVAAIIGTALTLAGYLLSDSGGVAWMVETNRAIAIFAIWSTAVLIMDHHKKNRALQRNLHIIDQNVKIAKFSSTGMIVDMSHDLCRYFGVAREEMVGTESDFFHKTLPEEVLREMWMILKSGKRWDGELRYALPTGEVKWAHSSIHPVFGDRYNITDYDNFIVDITDKKILEEISLTDPLTSLHNRRFFDDTLAREIKLARRGQWPLTLAIIDIDFFKNYNDHYGHPEGDAALISVANTLRQILKRPGDHVCRIGGEEFALFFSEVGYQESERFLTEVCEAIEALQIPHEKSEVNQFLTISVGSNVCSDGKAILDKDQLFKKADTALYTAKERRNCVVIVE